MHERPESAQAEVHRWFSTVYHNPDLTTTGGVHGTPEQVREQLEELDVHFVNTLPVDVPLWWIASFPGKRESRGRAPWGLDARVRGHDVLVVMALVPDL